MARLPVDSVIQATNGKDALDKLNDAWVDIIFTDINMPEMDGITFLEELGSNPEYRDIPVVVVSTEGSTERIAELRKKGIKGYLRKPFTPERLRDIILDTLGSWET